MRVLGHVARCGCASLCKCTEAGDQPVDEPSNKRGWALLVDILDAASDP